MTPFIKDNFIPIYDFDELDNEPEPPPPVFTQKTFADLISNSIIYIPTTRSKP